MLRYSSPVLMCADRQRRRVSSRRRSGSRAGCQGRRTSRLLSTQASKSVEEVVKARSGPVWFQLYTTPDFAITTKLVQRAEAAGCTAVAVTVDLPAGRNTVTGTRLARQDARNCGGVPQRRYREPHEPAVRHRNRDQADVLRHQHAGRRR